MFKSLFRFYQNRFLSRFLVLLIDVLATGLSLVIAIMFRFGFNLDAAQNLINFQTLTVVLLFYTTSFLTLGSYKGIIRHTSVEDIKKVLLASAIGGSACMIFSLSGDLFFESRPFPFSLIAFHFTLTFIALTGLRLGVKNVFIVGINQGKEELRVVIFGCGESGAMTKNALQQAQKSKFKIVAFVDDNQKLWGSQLQNIKIYAPNKALSKEWLDKHKIDNLVIASQTLPLERKRMITESAIEAGIEVLRVPPYRTWVEGNISAEQLKTIRIEDLLQRSKIELDSMNITSGVADKVILITGAAGSIGGEIARQLSFYQVSKLVLIDHAESPLYDLEQELNEQSQSQNTKLPICEVANVKDKYRMESIFKRYQPDLVFHAAAYKHVPIIERSPYEGIFVNVLGTRIVADLALEYNVERFVMVSTDKAVNPTNVMGATKRIAELYTQSLNEYGKTKFIATRFGNVLGSNGSVVPLFRKQIQKGGPVTVTHREITRYFMTIPEACNLVLEAGAMGNGGEVFVFDMGDPVKIMDLAHKMVKLSGLQLDRDIQITIIGLRPGEKLFEEMLLASENNIPTHHPKILIAEVETSSHAQLKKELDILSEIVIDGDVTEMVRKVKCLVPEYISKNSHFETLDS